MLWNLKVLFYLSPDIFWACVLKHCTFWCLVMSCLLLFAVYLRVIFKVADQKRMEKNEFSFSKFLLWKLSFFLCRITIIWLCDGLIEKNVKRSLSLQYKYVNEWSTEASEKANLLLPVWTFHCFLQNTATVWLQASYPGVMQMQILSDIQEQTSLKLSSFHWF